MQYKVNVEGSKVYLGDDPKYAMEFAQMLRNEEPKEIQVAIILVKE
jgi:hypothetical protein